MRSQAPIRIATPTEQQTLSAPQKKFNTLTQKIAVQRKLLAAWQEAVPLFQQRVSSTPCSKRWTRPAPSSCFFWMARTDRKA